MTQVFNALSRLLECILEKKSYSEGCVVEVKHWMGLIVSSILRIVVNAEKGEHIDEYIRDQKINCNKIDL